MLVFKFEGMTFQSAKVTAIIDTTVTAAARGFIGILKLSVVQPTLKETNKGGSKQSAKEVARRALAQALGNEGDDNSTLDELLLKPYLRGGVPDCSSSVI